MSTPDSDIELTRSTAWSQNFRPSIQEAVLPEQIESIQPVHITIGQNAWPYPSYKPYWRDNLDEQDDTQVNEEYTLEQLVDLAQGTIETPNERDSSILPPYPYKNVHKPHAAVNQRPYFQWKSV